ncbi:D-alanyl-D-alanine carboxypeptidase [Mobilitalea sibirica]|uniref:D-alanyl-D-alanine carboxypeptidase n=1 Tax=Mobilitalea sibirica TaxID=1462919 RepID=A0A8J7HDE4_9FIRM|nr:D-alanyl-D-alanine carboxypeptidase family protein [Mobilitalea sibirica]MBH1941947.1 D-alanyl-D-alanine carboxypeptidase [Mobilitalea sibirica]
MLKPKQRISFICLLIFLSSYIVKPVSASNITNEVVWPNGPNVYAEAAIVMEASTGLILYEKNIHQTYYPASITKIMTALIALENSSLGEVVTFSRDAIFEVELDSSRIGIDVGEQLTMQQCLYAILLASANEVTYAIAEHVAGSIPAFAEMMNEKAESLGCKNTNFTNPHGLPDSEHITTAYDMALITREAMKNETFRKITGTRTYQIPPTNIQPETRYLRNHHRFILKQDYTYDGAIGGKTGYTSKARYTLASVAKRGDLELITVVLKDDSFAHQYTDTQKLFDYGFDNFSIYSIADLENTNVVHESPFFTRYNHLLNKSDDTISTDEKGYLILPNTASFEDAKKEVSFYPAAKERENDTIIGTISYSYHNKYVGGADIILKNKEFPSLFHRTPNPGIAPIVPEDPKEKPGGSMRPVIIGIIVGIFVLTIGLYFVLVERPRLKRRSAYYKKRANRKLYRDNDYLDL